MPLSQQQQKIEAESTAQRAEQMGWSGDYLNFYRTTLDLYQVPDQIVFCKHGHFQEFDNVAVSNFFRAQPTGRFLSIGSANGIDQTYSLLQKGWSGVYCEPNPVALTSVDGHGLLRATKDFSDRVMIVNAAITSTSNVCKFYINQTIELSTIKKKFSTSESRPIIINSLGVNQLLDYVGEDFDYVQIDAEGTDIEIVNSIDWSTRLPDCKLIGIEQGNQCWSRLWNQGNYVIAIKTEHNTYFRREIVDYNKA